MKTREEIIKEGSEWAMARQMAKAKEIREAREQEAKRKSIQARVFEGMGMRIKVGPNDPNDQKK
jgi:hypothetical protein